jgi:hypothetical protein
VVVLPTHTGAGTPEGVVTSAVGTSYLDTTNGALWFKQSGAGDTGWVIASNITAGDFSGAPVPGFAIIAGTGDAIVVCADATAVTLSDVNAYVGGSGNSLKFNSAALDGDQYETLQLGPAGSPVVWQRLPDGSSIFPGPWTLFSYAGNPNTHVTALEAGDLCVDFTTPALWQATAADDAHWVLVNLPGAGSSPANPVWLEPVLWIYVNLHVAGFIIDPYTYYNGAGNDGIGATVTQNTPSDGALTINGGTPTIGDRVAFVDIQGGGYNACGIYTVTALGDGATVPWVLTRATDTDTSASLGRYWATTCPQGTDPVFGGGRVSVAYFPTLPFVIGADELDLNCNSAAGTVSGISFASAESATAFGFAAKATAYAACAWGDNNFASGNSSSACGNNSVAAAMNSFAGGSAGTVTVNANESFAFGGIVSEKEAATFYGFSYALGQHSRSSAVIAAIGDAQFSRTMPAIQTTDATPTVLMAAGSPGILFQDSTGAPVWDRTMIVRVRVVARRTDVAGTDSAWSFTGVLRGDGTSAYTWVGGSAPAKVLIAQDAGAALWNVAVAMDGTTHNQLDVTVTGAAATTINWEATVELDEVAG